MATASGGGYYGNATRVRLIEAVDDQEFGGFGAAKRVERHRGGIDGHRLSAGMAIC
jgi:hypothetical protein